MKLVLLVHNNLTLQFARKAVEYFQLNPENCLWIRDRRAAVPAEFVHTFDLDQAPLFEFRIADALNWGKQIRVNYRSLSRIDRCLSDFAPEGFQLIAPHSYDLRYHALITHPGCEGFYYLEEGKLSCAGNPGRRRNWKRPMVGLGHLFFLKGRISAFPPPFSTGHPKYKGVFAFSPFAFNGFKNRIELPLPFRSRPELAHFKQVLVLGPYVEFGELPQEVESRILKAFFAWFAAESPGRLYVKFHPAQLAQDLSAPVIRTLLNEFQGAFSWEEIPPSVSLEELAVSAQPDMYLATSSVALYAMASGARVHTYAPDLIKAYPPFRQVWEDLPLTVRNAMSPIPLTQ